jgi:hypothetical protein
MKPLSTLTGKTSKRIAIAVAVACSVWLAVYLRDQKTLSRGMPPGYYLECDGKNNYRPCHEGGRPVVWWDEYGSKAAATRRAQRQYDYENKLDTHKWVPCQ